MLRPALAVLALGLLGLSSVCVRAQPPMTRHFGTENACYGRSYSNAHLADHPDQRVAEISLGYFPTRWGLLDDAGAPRFYPEAPEIIVGLSVRLKASREIWFTTAFCWPDGDSDGMACAIECDAGQFSLVDRGPDRILITGGTDLWFSNCDAGDRVLQRAPDDHSFLLTRRPAADCAPD